MSNSIGSIGDHPLDDLAAYALDALSDSERRAVDVHLARCEVCRAELAGHHETLAVLTPDEAPPAELWRRIATGIGDPGLPDPHTARPVPPSPAEHARLDAGAEADADDRSVAPSPITPLARARARRSLRLSWVAAAASLTAVAAAAGVFGFALGSRDDGGNIRTLAEQAAEHPDGLLATLADPGGQPVARVVADEDGAYIQLEELENLPEGRAYQLWSLTDARPVSLGMLGRDGTNTVAFRLPPTITELAISIAPTSGDVAPNGEFRAAGSVVRQS